MGQTATPKNTVWCSAAWNYEYAVLPLATAYPVIGATPVTYDKLGTENTGTANTEKGDLGFCCYTLDVALANFVVPESDNTNTWDTTKLNKYTCPAKFGNNHEAAVAPNTPTTGAAFNLKDLSVKTQDWWCSDGTYNLTTATWSSATPGGFLKDTTEWNATDGVKLVMGNNDALVSTLDRRLELFLPACRQKKTICKASMIGETAAADGADAMKRTISATASGFGTGEKCTWTLRSLTKAPTFAVGGTTAGK